MGLTTKWKFPRHLRAAVGFHHNPESLSVELRNLATLVQTADTLCCQEKIGFYLTAQNSTITEEMLEQLGITPEQIEELRIALPEKVADAESVLAS